MAAKKKAYKAKKEKNALKAEGVKSKKKGSIEETNADEIKDIARDIDQGADNEEGVESKKDEDAGEIERLRKASTTNKEDEEEAVDDEGYGYERGVDKEDN